MPALQQQEFLLNGVCSAVKIAGTVPQAVHQHGCNVAEESYQRSLSQEILCLGAHGLDQLWFPLTYAELPAAGQDVCWYQHRCSVWAGKEDTSAPLVSSVSERSAFCLLLSKGRVMSSAEHLEEQGCCGFSLST